MRCYEKLKTGSSDLDIYLPFDQRNRSRGKATAGDGQIVAWFLNRGESLRQNDVLTADNGMHVRVVAADEPVSRATSGDELLLTRAAYHLGNRHVQVQINTDSLIYQADHVLDEMVKGLGLKVERVCTAFQPDDGAYSSHE